MAQDLEGIEPSVVVFALETRQQLCPEFVVVVLPNELVSGLVVPPFFRVQRGSGVREDRLPIAVARVDLQDPNKPAHRQVFGRSHQETRLITNLRVVRELLYEPSVGARATLVRLLDLVAEFLEIEPFEIRLHAFQIRPRLQVTRQLGDRPIVVAHWCQRIDLRLHGLANQLVDALVRDVPLSHPVEPFQRRAGASLGNQCLDLAERSRPGGAFTR